MKQRLLAGLLSTTMLLSMASPAVACLYHSNDVDCINTEAIAVAGGSISVNVIFENNETITQAHERDVKLTLHSGRFSSETISLANPPDNISGYPLSVAVRDSLGVVDGDSEYMGWYAVTIGGLDTADYYITLEGNNHVKYTSSTFVIDTYSKVLSVSTAGVDFTFGDVNKDGVVDQLDLDDMAQGIEIDNKEFDLSGDGKVDITDLAIIKSNIANQSSGVDGSEITYIERAIAGKTYMFAYATETVTTISDGLFIFKLDVENEAELQTDGSDCGALSLYPEQIKAVMTRVSDTGSYQTSDTVWTDTPSEYSMPEIVLN